MSKLKIYSAEGCPPCVELKAYLRKKKVDFKVIDISKKKNFEKVKTIIKKTKSMSVPIIEKGDKTLVGFNKAAVDGLIKDKK